MGVSLAEIDSSTSSVGVCSKTTVEVEVKVAVGNGVGVEVNVGVLVGVDVVAATITNSKGRSSNGSEAMVRNLSMKSPEAISGIASMIPTKLLTGTLRVSSKREDN